jgi:hypothetical protein
MLDAGMKQKNIHLVMAYLDVQIGQKDRNGRYVVVLFLSFFCCSKIFRVENKLIKTEGSSIK